MANQFVARKGLVSKADSNITGSLVISGSNNGLRIKQGKLSLDQPVDISFANGQIIDDNGSGGLRIYTPTYSTDIYSGKSGTLKFFTSGSVERVRLDAAGNMGIGTNSPSTTLHVAGNTAIHTAGTYAGANGDPFTIQDPLPAIRLIDSQATSRVARISAENGALHFESDLNSAESNNDIRFSLDGTERLRILNSGNVGIGTDSPGYKLDVSGSGRFSSRLTLNSPDYNQHLNLRRGSYGVDFILTGARLDISPTASTTEVKFLSNVTVTGSFSSQGATSLGSAGNDVNIGNASSGYMAFKRTGHNYIAADQSNGTLIFRTGGANNRMIINSDGNIGIGTLTPLAPLDVNGNIYSSGNLLVDTIFSRGGSSDLNLDGRAGYGVNVRSGSTSIAYFDYDTARVGIGTTSPDYKLHVAGEMSIDSYIRHNGDSNSFFGFDNTDSYKVRLGGGDRMNMSTTATTFSTDVTSTGYLQTYGRFYHREHIVVLNKAANGWVQWASRNTGGTDSVIDLSNIGDLSLDGNISGSGAINVSGAVTASYFKGDGSGLTDVTAVISLAEVLGTGNDGAGADMDNIGAITAVSLNAAADVSASNIDASGNFRINGTDVLDINGNYTTLRNPDGNIRLYVGNSSDTRTYYQNNHHRFRNAGNTENFGEWNTNGLGVGTTTPATELHVEGEGATASGNKYQFILSDNTAYGINKGGGLIFRGDYNSATSQSNFAAIRSGKANANDGNANAYLAFLYGASGTLTEGMRIDYNGKVGIGTTSPSEKLEVIGTIKQKTGAAYTNYVQQSVSEAQLEFSTYSNNQSTFPSAIKFSPNGTEAVRIDNSGAVGIGVPNPGDFNSAADNLVVGTGAGSNGITVYSGTSSAGGLYFADASGSGAGNRDGVINYSHGSATMELKTGGNQKVLSIATGTSTFHMGNVVMENDLTVKGTVTAEEFHTEFVSSSIIYSSGSTKFGDTSDDDHEFTGSVSISGNNTALTIKNLAGSGADTGVEIRGARNGTVDGVTSYLNFTNYDDNSGGLHSLGRIYGSMASTGLNDGTLTIQTYNGSDYVNGIKIHESGNTGIGGTLGVGILEASASSTLDVVSTTTPEVYIRTSAVSNQDAILRIRGSRTTSTTSEIAQIRFETNDSAASGIDLARISALKDTASTNVGRLEFKTMPTDGGTLATRMTIKGDGNVGIGTTSPETKLHVASGDILISNGQYYTAESTTGGNYKLAGLTTGNQVHIGAIDYASAATTFAGGDHIKVTTGGVGGSTRMYISGSGNVGIGTSSPSQKLTVAGNILQTSNSNYIATRKILARDSNGLDLMDDSGGNGISIKDGGNVVINAGNLGIGATSPSYNLTVYNDSLTDSFPIVAGSGVSTGEFVGIGLSGYVASNGAVKAGMVLDRVGNFGTGDIHFLNNSTEDNNDATLSDSKLVIKEDGKVGIGTSAPADKLHVSGAGFFSGTTADDTAVLKLGQLTGASTEPLVTVYTDDDGADKLEFYTGRYGSVTSFTHASASSSDRIDSVLIAGSYLYGGSIKMYGKGGLGGIKTQISTTQASFFNGGDVGIGTTSPEANLHILKNSANGSQYERLIIDGDTQNTTSSGSSQAITFKGSGNNYAGAVGSYGNGSSGGIGIWNGTTNSGDPKVMFVNDRIGVGITNPSYRLDISGAQRIQHSASETGLWVLTNSAVPTEFQVKIGRDTGQYYGIRVDDGTARLIHRQDETGTGTHYISNEIWTNVSNGGVYQWKTGNNAGGSLVESMRLDGDGRLLLGTTSPAEKLTVEGNISASGFINVDGAVTASYFKGNGSGLTDVTATISLAEVLGTGNDAASNDIDNVGAITATSLSTSAEVSASYLYADSGTSSAPAISFGGDTNTGIYNGAADKLHFTAGGTLKARIDSNGLAVYTGNAYIASGYKMNFDLNVSNNYFVRKNSSNLEVYSAGNVAIGADSATKLFVSQSGNVGIGTTNPGYILDVSGTSRIAGTIHMYGAVRNYSGDFSLQNGVQDADILFKVNDGGTTTTAMMVDGATSRVGIGTTSPGVKLDISAGSNDGIRIATNNALLGKTTAGDTQLIFWNGDHAYYGRNPGSAGVVRSHSFRTDGSDAMYITGSFVGIGTSSPSRTLDVNGDIQNNGILRKSGNVYIKSTGTSTLIGPGGDGRISFHSSATMTASDEKMRINEDGTVGIGTTSPSYTLDVTGEVGATSFIETSARKFKENIEPIQGALDIVSNIDGVTFNRIGEERREYGFIADEIESTAPELVSYDANGEVHGVHYARTVAVLTEAVKELNDKVKAQDLFIKDLVARIEKLENK